MAKMTMGSGRPQKLILQKPKEADLKYMSLDEILAVVDGHLEKHKPVAPEPPTIIEKHHTKTISVTHENTKTIDKRARKYSKLLRKELKDTHNRISLARDQIIELHNKVKELQSRKPEEKQIVTVETRTVETVKEIEYKLDKRVLVVLGVSLLMNILILILK